MDDTLCRRCGVDLPARPPIVPAPAGLHHSTTKPRLHLPWLLGGVVAYLVLLLLGFQFFADTFRAYASVLGEVKTLADFAKHEDVLLELFWRVLALVGVAYATGAVLLGRLSPGRPVVQAVVAALISWLGISWRAASLAPGVDASGLLPILVGGVFVTLVAFGAAAFGAWLRPKPPPSRPPP